MGMVSTGGRVYCVGGFDGNTPLDSVFSLDPRTRSWVLPLLRPILNLLHHHHHLLPHCPSSLFCFCARLCHVRSRSLAPTRPQNLPPPPSSSLLLPPPPFSSSSSSSLSRFRFLVIAAFFSQLIFANVHDKLRPLLRPLPPLLLPSFTLLLRHLLPSAAAASVTGSRAEHALAAVVSGSGSDRAHVGGLGRVQRRTLFRHGRAVGHADEFVGGFASFALPARVHGRCRLLRSLVKSFEVASQ